MDIVEILSTGVSGFAFLMLWVGFQLTNRIQGKILDVKLSDTDPEKLELWSKLAERQVVNTRYFMAFSTIFLFAGLTVLMYRPPANLMLSISPSEGHLAPKIYAHNILVDLEEGRGWAKIKDDQALQIDNNVIFSEIVDLRAKLRVANDSNRDLAKQTASHSADAGYGL